MGGINLKKSITIDKNKCIHCGMCIKDCIVGCIKFSTEKIPEYVECGESMCVACQHCMAICPVGALSFGEKNPKNSESVNYGNSDDLLSLIKSRRSFRHYKAENIPAETISKLTEMLAYPPTGGNVDTLHFSIVGSLEKMQEIVKITREKVQILDSPIAKILKDYYDKGMDFVYRDAPSMIAVSVNTAKAVPGCENADPIIALSYLDLYAQSLGLGTLWTDAALSIIKEIPEIQTMLKIPEGYSLNYIMLFGMPAIKYHRTAQPDPAYIDII